MRIRRRARILTHFWFPVPGHRGIGVTAASLAQATELATAVATTHGWTLDARLVEQNVEVGDLRLDEAVAIIDATRPGVWYPVGLPSIE